MMKRSLLSSIALLSCVVATAQTLTWSRVPGRSGETVEWGNSIIPTYEGGYAVTGLSGGIGFGQEDMLLMKLDNAGDTLWVKGIGDPAFNDQGAALLQTADSGFVLCGTTEGSGAGGADMWLVKTDKNGIVQWQRTYGEGLNDIGSDIEQVNDGFVIAGYGLSLVSLNYVAYVVRTDLNGDTLWTRKFDGSGHVEIADLTRTQDNGLLLTGTIRDSTTDANDVYLMRLDPAGNLLWNKRHQGNATAGLNIDAGLQTLQTPDGGYVTAAAKNQHLMDYSGQAWLLRTNAAGDTSWTWTFDSINHISHAKSLALTPDSGYLVMLDVYHTNAEKQYIAAYRFRKDGVLLWHRNITENIGSGPHVNDVRALGNNQYIIGGYTHVTGSGYQALAILMRDSLVTEQPAAINELHGMAAVSIYPNPTMNDLYLKETRPVRFSSYTIYDNLGRLIRRQNIGPGRMILTGSLLPGAYLLLLDGKYPVRFIKQ